MGKRFTTMIVMATLLTTGCVGQNEMVKSRVTMPNGRSATIVSYNNNFPMFLRSRDNYSASYIVPGDGPTSDQLKAVDVAENFCRDHVRIVHPHRAVKVLAHGLAFGAAGAAGGALGALAFPGAIVGQYAQFGGASGGLYGLAYGGIVLSGENYTFQSCSRELMQYFSEYKVHVILGIPSP